MLFYGDSSIIGILNSESTVIFNISSLREGLPRLQLIPPKELGRYYERDFDIIYANYIMNNDAVFCQFFTIVYNLYCNKDVYLVMDNSDWSENIIESICKLIQQRYGYESMKLNSYEDYIYAMTNIIGEFNPYYGIANLDMDKERYSYINENIRINNGGKPYTDNDEY